MTKNIAAVICILLIMSGCVYQADLRPEYNDTDVWICEKPYIELYWNTSAGHTGKIFYDDIPYNIIHEENYGSLIRIYTTEAESYELFEEKMQYCLFQGRIIYGKKSLTIEVKEDFKNIFGGEKPVMKFVKHNKEKYFNGKNIEVKNVEHRNK